MASSPTSAAAPLVAIVGRPNVGKSTLFNRLIGRRRAITDATPKVTRDPVSGDWDLDGRRVRLVDTGGLTLARDGLDRRVTERSLETIRRARVVLLMFDVTDYTPEDETFVEELRPYAEKILVVVNKIDGPKREHDLWSFHSLGFSHVVGVSASHGLGMDELRSAILERIAITRNAGSDEEAAETDASDMHLAVLGKPNTGKSTLVNRLTGTEGSLVSEVPGTTRDVLEGRFIYKDMTYRILDTAGIRRKRRVRDDVEYYSVNRAIGSIRDADVVLLVIDVVEGLSDQDKKIAQLIVKEGRGVVLVLNKWDLLPTVGNQFAAMQDKVRFFFPVLDFAPIVPISAMHGTGMSRLLNTTYAVWQQLHRRVDTSDLNAALRRWVEQTPPPMDNGRPFRVRYATQISAKPVRFVFFVNRRRGFPRPYVRYLTNRIRSDLGFSQVPINLEIRES